MNTMEAAETTTRLVRPAREADVPRLVEMGMRFGLTVYRGLLHPSALKIAALARQLLADPMGTVLVLERDGAVVGMMGLWCYPHPMAEALVATEVAWWVDPERRGDGLRLLRAGEAWARERGADVFQLIAPTVDAERLYQHLRFTEMETSFQKRLR